MKCLAATNPKNISIRECLPRAGRPTPVDHPNPMRFASGHRAMPRNRRATEPDRVATRSAEPRTVYELRGRTYRLRNSEIATMVELGKFRAVASKGSGRIRLWRQTRIA